jgi:pre-mRNA 3'-end-processing factor FIP1
VMQQQMYPVMDGGNTPVQAQGVRPGPPAPFRGRGQGIGMRGRGAGFQGRGGSLYRSSPYMISFTERVI